MTVAHSGPAEEEQRKVNASIERLQKAGDGLVERFQKKCRQLEAAELQVGELMSLLKKYEWADSSGPESVKICPACAQDKDSGHNHDCILATVVGSDRYHHPNESSPEKRVIESRESEFPCPSDPDVVNLKCPKHGIHR